MASEVFVIVFGDAGNGAVKYPGELQMKIEIITIPLGFDQCYILKGDGVIAIDAGQQNKGKVFAGALEIAEISPDAVRLVVLTHGHWDHIGSAGEIRALTGASLAMHRSEAHWGENSPTSLSPGVTLWGRVLTAVLKVFMPLIKTPAANVDIEFGDDGFSLVDFGIPGRVLHTPGHSSGSATVLLDSGEAFVGDLAMNRFPLRLSPGLPIFANDPAAVIKSWKMLIELGASTVYPAHGKPFPISVIEKEISQAS